MSHLDAVHVVDRSHQRREIHKVLEEIGDLHAVGIETRGPLQCGGGCVQKREGSAMRTMTQEHAEEELGGVCAI